MEINDITYKIIGAVYKVYNNLGPGLLESAYKIAMVHELSKQNIKVDTEVSIDIEYDGEPIKNVYRIDLLVEDSVVVELKSVSKLKDIHHKQLLTYMKLAKKPVGLLVNFNTTNIRTSICRKIISISK